ncbi:Phenylpyruvate tautomerase PptA, 4-oxalocrotonate tautomerase family [Mycolicibacterium rutilum]|uniref:Phenylpyruvate tautomerase PptA, 4-oxalocrotonate tautomerase family n=1 Tax=Mycolicibacterium rutilum TaxID=370526 RepID=A0A1H6LU75_MYCRU|nr:tautomerase family protein [Mycolicibacterium rutilum]SEH92288.1 Phenylpyruvate tautomerase PptA, 4-oxalocrotonate tautomerase family [Mycolicibacterium rutilum]
MPIYTITTAAGTLDSATKADLAAEVTRIHSDVNHVPSTYVNVVFNELAPDNVYTDAKPTRPLIINGWVRSGHPDEETSRLVTEIAHAATQVTGIPPERVLVVIGNSPARFAIEGGRVLPEPGQEQAWLLEGA